MGSLLPSACSDETPPNTNAPAKMLCIAHFFFSMRVFEYCVLVSTRVLLRTQLMRSTQAYGITRAFFAICSQIMKPGPKVQVRSQMESNGINYSTIPVFTGEIAILNIKNSLIE